MTVSRTAQRIMEADPERPRNAELLKGTRPGGQAAVMEKVIAGTGYIGKIGNLGNMCYAVRTVIFTGS